MSSTNEQIDNAKEVVAYYTLAASATGAIPVPASSSAIIAESACMVAHVASKLGVEIDMGTVMSSIGTIGAINVVGRALFIDFAKFLSWGTGSIWALAGLSVVGASTAGIQTYIIGMLAIEIGKNKGNKLSEKQAKSIIGEAKNSYDSFTEEWKVKNPVMR